MEEMLTAEEIEKKFDSEWVLVVDPQTDEHNEVRRGIVRCHSKDRDEVYRCAIQLPAPKHFAVLFTGEIPDDTVIVL
jgi:hypothetical protein